MADVTNVALPAVFVKLNFKQPKSVLIMNAPGSFEPEVRKLPRKIVNRDLAQVDTVDFALLFVQKRAQVAAVSKALAKKAAGDSVVWFAYPKGTSKSYQSEINRDSGWEPFTALGFETVRLVAIDEDWSALRFRRSEFVKNR
jgi:hypothetical protein